jgi:hypothetical protein
MIARAGADLDLEAPRSKKSKLRVLKSLSLTSRHLYDIFGLISLPHLVRLDLHCDRFSTTQASRELIASSKLVAFALRNIGKDRFASDFVANLHRFPLKLSDYVTPLFFQRLKDTDTPTHLVTLVLQNYSLRADPRGFWPLLKDTGRDFRSYLHHKKWDSELR